MAPPRTGTLELRKRGGHLRWHTRVTVTNKDGTTSRPWYCLDTEDKATAERRRDKLLKDIAAGRTEAEATNHASMPESVKGYADALGSRISEDDRRNLRVHVVPTLGALALDDVRLVHVKSIRDKLIAGGARRATCHKVLGAVRRLFAYAVEDELLEQNPAGDVKLPKLRGADREIVKPRTILTDDEIGKYLACEEADLELRMLSLVARCEGGMRASDLRVWDWTHIDLDGFKSCVVPRSKTAAPEVLDVPDVLRPFLRAWWELAGKPIAGPVRIGARAGEMKHRSPGYADRLRRDLAKAGVFRLPPVLRPAPRPGRRNDIAEKKTTKPEKMIPAPNPRDPLYFETPSSRPVDFHSFRRAFATALARTNVNTQRAVRLAGHADAKTHLKYVADAPEMRTIPEAALPASRPWQFVANHQDAREISGPHPRARTTPIALNWRISV
jgi:integrase